MAREISPQRKSLYTVGMVTSVIGGLMFLSTFVTFLMHFGDFSNFESNARSDGFRAFGGMALIIAGGFMMNLAARGAAGSGLKLDPKQARKDLEPWARMQGGLAKDSFDEMGVDIPKMASAISTGLGGGAGRNAESFEERLRGLHALYKDGILSEEEYLREKQELLEGK